MTWLIQGLATPQPDGVAVAFSTASPYEPGSLRAYAQGQKIGLDCVVEVDPSTGAFSVPLAEPLTSGWRLEVVYVDPSAPDGILADQIRVEIDAAPLEVVISSATIRADILDDEKTITAVLDVETITADIFETDTITVELCP